MTKGSSKSQSTSAPAQPGPGQQPCSELERLYEDNNYVSLEKKILIQQWKRRHRRETRAPKQKVSFSLFLLSVKQKGLKQSISEFNETYQKVNAGVQANYKIQLAVLKKTRGTKSYDETIFEFWEDVSSEIRDCCRAITPLKENLSLLDSIEKLHAVEFYLTCLLARFHFLIQYLSGNEDNLILFGHLIYFSSFLSAFDIFLLDKLETVCREDLSKYVAKSVGAKEGVVNSLFRLYSLYEANHAELERLFGYFIKVFSNVIDRFQFGFIVPIKRALLDITINSLQKKNMTMDEFLEKIGQKNMTLMSMLTGWVDDQAKVIFQMGSENNQFTVLKKPLNHFIQMVVELNQCMMNQLDQFIPESRYFESASPDIDKLMDKVNEIYDQCHANLNRLKAISCVEEHVAAQKIKGTSQLRLYSFFRHSPQSKNTVELNVVPNKV